MTSDQLRHRKASKSNGYGAGAASDCPDVDIDDRRRPRPLSLLLPFYLVTRFFSRLLSTYRMYRKWRSTRLRDFGAALPPDGDNVDRPPRRPIDLPTDAALAALGLDNCRDLASACPDVVVPGRLFRSASPFALSTERAGGRGRGGGGGRGHEVEGDEDAAAAAAEETARLLSHAAATPSSSPERGLGLTLVIDLRSDNEWQQGRGDAVVEALSKEKQEKKEVEGRGDDEEETSKTVVVERVPLQAWQRYTHAFVARLPLERSLAAAAHFLFFKSILRFEPPLPGMHARLCEDTEKGGLVAMNTTVLSAFPAEIARVLRLISAALVAGSSPSSPFLSPPRLPSPSSSSRRSVLVSCKLGKDRTGVTAALCLAVAGASLEDVVDDYARSGEELSGRPPPPTAPSLGGAPRAAMERTLEWLARHWGARAPTEEVEAYRRREQEATERRGKRDSRPTSVPASFPRYCWRSGVIGYLEHEARFLAEEREALRKALTE